MPLSLSRSLLTIILPGIVATAPWLLLLIVQVPGLRAWYGLHALPIHVAAFAVAVTSGAVFEGLGNYIECIWDRARAEKEIPALGRNDWVQREWYAYLGRSFGSGEPVAYRYLSRKVTAFYFEMGMMFAVPIGLIGLGALTEVLLPSTQSVSLVFGALVLISPFLFLRFADDTHEVLCETRYFTNHKLDRPEKHEVNNALAKLA